jgi:intracellular sulfur oxidation DsrE/DsrF family protein
MKLMLHVMDVISKVNMVVSNIGELMISHQPNHLQLIMVLLLHQ